MADEVKNNELRCIGCGAVLQSQDETKSGYLPASVLEKKSAEDLVYCKRCFRLRHYNEVQDIELSDDDFLNMLHELNEENALIVNVIDLFDFNGSIISGIQRFAGSNPIVIVANKSDLLPKSLGEGKMRQWVTEQVQSYGIRPQNVYLISALNKASVEKFMEALDKERQGKDVYVVGTTNVGKSTLINQIINIATDSEDTITTSYFPGTTLGKIEIPLDDEKVLVDTPGIIQKSQLSHYLDAKDLKVVTPRKEVKPKNYQLNDNQTLFFGGLARFDYLMGEGKESFVCYVSNELYIHRTKTERADELYENQLGELLTPPNAASAADFPALKRHEFKIKEPSDIVFSGLGWVSIDAVDITVAGWAPLGVDVTVRKQLI
ncbi:ribosome biogenesis GTPase YqeH [Alkalibacterium putridalgicola]|uniref:Ribosome biogenesis GTPase YqeH n=1 Tax=Alkalibacterium putridalgicola TaxID=426703 RepID=A0ABQ0UZT1_9LACT|nr:ribosome biogenesis GTPase YqeH [Alkalibacterium putridalgicola]GEK89902.1 ribosome biogenesis GTPase YqeH [Alkalibacterium putridalgicola]